jgi:hypothetical protein
MNRMLVGFTVIASIFATGCTTQRSWVYHSDAEVSPRQSEKRVVVLPFEDRRKNENKDSLGWSIVPLVPFTTAELHIPEGKDFHVASGEWENYEPTRDFSRALAHELNQRRMFSSARFSEDITQADYVVTGKILKTDYDATLYTYGVSFYAPVLWALGLPQSHVNNSLSVQIELTDQATGEILVSDQYAAPEYEVYSWVYNIKSDFEYPELSKAAFEKFIRDVELKLATMRS